MSVRHRVARRALRVVPHDMTSFGSPANLPAGVSAAMEKLRQKLLAGLVAAGADGPEELPTFADHFASAGPNAPPPPPLGLIEFLALLRTEARVSRAACGDDLCRVVFRELAPENALTLRVLERYHSVSRESGSGKSNLK